MMSGIFYNAAQALAHAVECQMATLEYLRGLARPPKHELRRYESIVRDGLANCRVHVSEEDAKRARAGRVLDFLAGERDEVGRRVEAGKS